VDPSRRIARIVTAVALAALCTSGVSEASARSTILRPPPVAIALVLPVEAVRLAPGTTYVGSARVRNPGAASVIVALYAARAVDEPTGAVGLVPTHTWMRISTDGVRIPPRSAARWTFAVTVPRGTPPGAYVLAVAAQERTTPRTLGAGAVLVGYRSVSLLVVVVPGTLAVKLHAEDWTTQANPAYRSDDVRVRLINRGNAYSYVATDLTVRSGHRLWRMQGATLLILAHASVNLTFVVPWRVLGGHSVGTVTVRDGTGSETLSGPLPAPPRRGAPAHRNGSDAQGDRDRAAAQERRPSKDGSSHDQ